VCDPGAANRLQRVLRGRTLARLATGVARFKLPPDQNFIKLYKEKGYDKQFPINTHSGYAWDAIMIVANAIKKVGTDAAALRTEIENTRNYVGISGTYNITPEDHNGLDVNSMVMVQVKNGKFIMAK